MEYLTYHLYALSSRHRWSDCKCCKMFTFPCLTSWRQDQLALVWMKKLRHCQPMYIHRTYRSVVDYSNFDLSVRLRIPFLSTNSFRASTRGRSWAMDGAVGRTDGEIRWKRESVGAMRLSNWTPESHYRSNWWPPDGQPASSEIATDDVLGCDWYRRTNVGSVRHGR